MPHYLSVRQMAEKHPAFSEASLRYHIFHERQNGLAGAIRRLGRKVLIDEGLFFRWVENQKGGAV
jgi:hypothetical protein